MADFCDLMVNHLFLLLKYIVSIIGLILNLLNILAFTKLINNQNHKDNLFKYLLLKSFCDFFVMLMNVLFGTFDIYFKDAIKSQNILCISRLIFDEYMCFNCQLISMLCDVASCFTKYRSIQNKFLFLNKIPIWFKLISMIVYSSTFYSYKFFQRYCHTIETKSNNSNNSYFVYNLRHYPYFLLTPLDYGFSITHSIIRDGICSILIIIINILILVCIRKVFKNKVDVLKCKNTKDIDRAQKSQIYMILTTGTITFTCHLFMFIYYLPIIPSNKCVRNIFLILIYIIISINFFVYYIFNLNFRRFINNQFTFLKIIFIR